MDEVCKDANVLTASPFIDATVVKKYLWWFSMIIVIYAKIKNVSYDKLYSLFPVHVVVYIFK